MNFIRNQVLVITAAFFLSGCSTFHGIFAEDKANSILREYVGPIVYPMSRLELAKFIVTDIEKNHRWHLEHDFLYRTGASLTQPTFNVKGEGPDLQEVQAAYEPEGERVGVLYDDAIVLKDKQGRNLFRERVPKPVEFSGVREVYVLNPVDKTHSSVWILNSADRKRLYNRELDLYESIYPEQAKSLKETIQKEHPDIEFQPFG